MAGFGIKVTGLGKAQQLVSSQGAKTATALDVALFEVANDLFNKSQRLVPVDKGMLRGSGSLSKEAKLGGTEFFVTYGGPAAPYALFVHEDMNAKHDAPTQAKYLEMPFIRARASLKRTIEAKIRQVAR
jgi:hypothetical protein